MIEYTLSEAAKRLNVSIQSVRNYIKKGLLKAEKKTIAGFKYKLTVNSDELLRFKEANKF